MALHPGFIYLITLVALLVLVIILQKKYCLLCDSGKAVIRSYSYARTQLAWWSFIIIASFAAVVIATGQLPVLDQSALLLLTISATTTSVARVVDVSDQQKTNAVAAASGNPPALLSKDYPSQGFLIDILSDNQQVGIHRLQSFLFNVIFGCWFIYKTFVQIRGASPKMTAVAINNILPVLSDNNLILLGISAGTYAALKAAENKV